MLKRHGYTIAFIGWMAIITLLSLFSFSSDQGPKIDIPNFDKAVHFGFYFIAVCLGCFFLRERTAGKIHLHKAIIIMAVSLIIYGIIIEVIQGVFTLKRTGDFYDGLANSVGAFCGAWIIKLLFSWKRQLKWKI